MGVVDVGRVGVQGVVHVHVLLRVWGCRAGLVLDKCGVQEVINHLRVLNKEKRYGIIWYTMYMYKIMLCKKL